ncbi:MAG: restriction endonuclease subunit S [Candidatus Delongbacteria bacterium]|nr:restriction endonuclease subunit S [Candidatus Delongbacteria bacterium]
MSDSNLLLDPLPPGWENHKFGDICNRVKDSYKPIEGGDTPYVGLEHLAQGFPVFVGRGKESDVKSAKTAFKVDDILFGKLRPYLRKGARANFDGVCSTDILAFRATPSCESEYLKFVIHSNEFIDHAKSTTSGVQHPRTSWPSLKEFRLSLPPLAEQKKMAHILSTVQKAIEAQERIIQTTTELKKALMHKLFTEGLRNEPQKQTEIGPVPESWEVKRFDSFAVLQRGFDITKKDQRPGEYPVVSSGGVSSYHDEPKVKGPGVVIGRKGTLGTVHYIPTDYWPHDTTLWVKDFKGNDPRFVGYLLKTMRLKRFDTGAANPTLNRNIVHGEKIVVPPKGQQVEIGEALETVESKITFHESRKHSFQDLFLTLLHELMTAKSRVHRLEISL